MQTRLIFADSKKNIEITRKKLLIKYKTIEDLASEVQKKKCNAPEEVDDYMLWQTLSSYEKQVEELGENISMSVPPLIFKEEIINFTSDFYQVLTPRRMELLNYINTHNIKSVKELALELKRDYKNVYDDVLALEKYQLLELIREGKNKRPVSRVTGIEIILNK